MSCGRAACLWLPNPGLFSNSPAPSGRRFCRGSFYGQTAKGEPLHDAIGVTALCEIIRRTPPGVTDLACHRGYADGLESVYRLERAIEVTVLCDPRVRAVAGEQGIEFVNFTAPGSN